MTMTWANVAALTVALASSWGEGMKGREDDVSIWTMWETRLDKGRMK